MRPSSAMRTDFNPRAYVRHDDRRGGADQDRKLISIHVPT